MDPFADELRDWADALHTMTPLPTPAVSGAAVAPSPLLTPLLDRLAEAPRFATHGRVTRVVGLVIEAAGLDVGLGELCRVTSLNEQRSTLSEVVGFHERGVLLMPLGEMDGLHPGSSVTPLGRSFGVDVGPTLLGRVLNGLGHPIDGLGKLEVTERVPLVPSRRTRSTARSSTRRWKPGSAPSTAC